MCHRLPVRLRSAYRKARSHRRRRAAAGRGVGPLRRHSRRIRQSSRGAAVTHCGFASHLETRPGRNGQGRRRIGRSGPGCLGASRKGPGAIARRESHLATRWLPLPAFSQRCDVLGTAGPGATFAAGFESVKARGRPRVGFRHALAKSRLLLQPGGRPLRAARAVALSRRFGGAPVGRA